VSFRSHAVPEFWDCYSRLPESVRTLADKKYALFQENPFHPSLGFQQKGGVWTVDIGVHTGRLIGGKKTLFIGTGSAPTKTTTSCYGAKGKVGGTAADTGARKSKKGKKQRE
jgi:hypothetical protein